jgi:hypothetical protein
MDTVTFPDFTAAKAALRQVSLEDFWAYMQQHNYIFAPARALWPGSSVNSRLPKVPLTDADGQPVLNKNGEQVEISPTAWLDKHKPVEQMTWAPGLSEIIRNRLLHEGGWIKRGGVTCYNLYLPPTIVPGDPGKAGPWINHVRLAYPDDADHVLDWLAHRVQRPADKINHALVLGGEPGIGKDTLLAPVREAIGPWNFQEVSPTQILTSRFNGYLKSVILRVSEARDLGEYNRFVSYDHMKIYTAVPPEVLRIDEKHIREYPILNCCGVVILTNYKTDGIYLPADDRRHYVAWSPLTKEDARFQNGYWNTLWGWYQKGGFADVAAYLARRKIVSFDAKAPPPKTPVFWSIVDANRAPEISEITEAIDRLGKPDAFTLEELKNAAYGSDLWGWLDDRKNRRTIPHRLESCGYVPVRNPDAPEDGYWRISKKRQAIYARKELPLHDQIAFAREFCRTARP